MTVSLLHPNPTKSCTERLPESILYRFSLDRSFLYICSDEKKREQFFSVVSSLTADKEEILYRQEIIKDFSNNPALIEQLLSLSTQFEELRNIQKNTGKDIYRLKAAGTSSSASSKNILQKQALCLKRALLFVKAYGELLAKYDLQSKGLKNLYSACREMYESPDFAKLITYCSKYENFSASGYWNFKFAINVEGHIETYELIDHRYIHVTDPELKKKGFAIFRKAEEPVFPCTRLPAPKDDFFENLSISALSDLSDLFGKISEQIFLQYGALGPELVFYDAALKYIQALAEKKAPICYPTFRQDQGIAVKNLYDLYLLMTKPDSAEVIPNNFIMEQNTGGVMLFGSNGSGKTVYLRSVGTMQILAQAGLPIPCESAEITLFSQLAAQFSEAEKEFCEGNDAGRFEQEVRELAAMVDSLKEDSLVFLNETFQSTAYAEGAEGLYHLLKYFSALNIRWILVSHLRQLEEMFDPGEIKFLHTRDGYRIL